MGKIYKRNKWDRFTIPFYRRAFFWQMIATVILILLSLVISYFKIYDLYLISPVIAILILLVISILISLYKYFKLVRFHSLKYHLACRKIEKQITKSLINTMSVNTMLQTKRIEVPKVLVDLKSIHKDGRATTSLERLPSMNNVDELIILISNAFRHKYKDYSVVDFIEEKDKLSFKFYLESVNLDKTFTPKNIDDYDTNNAYYVPLQKGLIWRLNKAPHALISGVTNSGKSTIIYSLILHFFKHGVNDIKNDITDGSLYLVDPKFEFSAMEDFYKNIYTDIPSVFEMLETVNSNLEERQRLVSKLIKESGKLGATAFDFDIKCDIIIIDELTALVSAIPTSKKEEYNQDRFFSLISQIIQRGRSSGVYILFAGQNFNASSSLPVAIRNAPALRILLSEGTQEDYKFIFSNNTETIDKGGLPRQYMGYYTLSGVSDKPQWFFVPNLHENELNDTDTFKIAYTEGLKNG